MDRKCKECSFYNKGRPSTCLEETLNGIEKYSRSCFVVRHDTRPGRCGPVGGNWDGSEIGSNETK